MDEFVQVDALESFLHNAPAIEAAYAADDRCVLAVWMDETGIRRSSIIRRSDNLLHPWAVFMERHTQSAMVVLTQINHNDDLWRTDTLTWVKS